jgi:ribosomal protein S18 acetylase RimI-like enzyme
LEAVLSQPGVSVRRARLRDWWRIYRVVRGSFAGEFVDPVDLLVLLLIPWGHGLVAEVEGGLAGTAFVLPNPFADTAWISTVGVLPQHRRRGLARALMLAVEQITDKPCLRLDVYADNAPALTLYNGLGYREVAQHGGSHLEPRRRVEMEKRR